MKVLFDNNVPAPLRRFLLNHEVSTAWEMGWHALENGNLLAAAEGSGFEAMVTGDQNIAYQQNLSGRRLALVVLPTVNWKILQTNTVPIAAAVDRAGPGSFERVETGPFLLRPRARR